MVSSSKALYLLLSLKISRAESAGAALEGEGDWWWAALQPGVDHSSPVPVSAWSLSSPWGEWPWGQQAQCCSTTIFLLLHSQPPSQSSAQPRVPPHVPKQHLWYSISVHGTCTIFLCSVSWGILLLAWETAYSDVGQSLNSWVHWTQGLLPYSKVAPNILNLWLGVFYFNIYMYTLKFSLILLS